MRPEEERCWEQFAQYFQPGFRLPPRRPPIVVDEDALRSAAAMAVLGAALEIVQDAERDWLLLDTEETDHDH